MHRLLVATALVGASVVAGGPAEAKSIWLQCGKQQINLDSERERFSLTFVDKVFQGPAMFSPGQINFEFLYLNDGRGGGIKYAYAIDRKTLDYTETSLLRVNISRATDTGWIVSETKGNPASGQCSIMKTSPTEGNKI